MLNRGPRHTGYGTRGSGPIGVDKPGPDARAASYAPRMGSPKQSPEDIDKRTFASVTTTACTCNYLERASEEPRSPIVFDVAMQEYHIKNIGEDAGHSMVYHCPFCGGAAPKSKRASFFATITDTEWGRLRDLTRGLKTVVEVIEKFGEPDQDLPDGLSVKSRGSETEAQTVNSYRMLLYTKLSETAVVQFIDYGPDRGVRATFQGKHLGKPGSSRGP